MVDYSLSVGDIRYQRELRGASGAMGGDESSGRLESGLLEVLLRMVVVVVVVVVRCSCLSSRDGGTLGCAGVLLTDPEGGCWPCDVLWHRRLRKCLIHGLWI